MANLHPTTDTDFQTRQYGRQFTEPTNATQPNRYGIQNAVVETREFNPSDRRSVGRPKDRRSIARPASLQPGITPSGAQPTPQPRTRRSFNTQSNVPSGNFSRQSSPARTRKLSNPIGQASAHARAGGVSLIIFSWTGALWLFIQLPFAVFSILMLGASIWVADSYVYSATITVWNFVSELLGMPTVDVVVLFFIGLIITALSGLTALIGAAVNYKSALLHPLGGQGAGMKQFTFLLALIMYWLPGANLLPWVWLWTVVVIRYPK